MEESINYMNEKFLEYFNQNDENIAGRIDVVDLQELYLVTPSYLKPYLEYIKKHQRIFLTAMKRSIYYPFT